LLLFLKAKAVAVLAATARHVSHDSRLLCSRVPWRGPGRLPSSEAEDEAVMNEYEVIFML
jgi:hypothetical protein